MCKVTAYNIHVPELFCSLVVHTDNKRCTVGMSMASPIPTIARTPKMGIVVSRIQSADIGVTIVATDQISIPTVISVLGEVHDMNNPAGMMANPYPILNNEEINPFIVSVMTELYSYDIGTSATDMATRSNADIAAMNHSNINTFLRSCSIGSCIGCA